MPTLFPVLFPTLVPPVRVHAIRAANAAHPIESNGPAAPPARASPVIANSTNRSKRAGPRRSHAERSAETRSRILAAVVECISEIGFQRTTAGEIAGRAGVTWGAVQHHFGGKDGILRAVLEDDFARFAARFEDAPVAGGDLEARAGLFIDRAWEHFSSVHYRSTYEILLGYANDASEDGAEGPSWQAQMGQAWDETFTRLFQDYALPRRRRLTLGHYVLSVLMGLAASLMLQPGAAIRPEELDLLKETLVRELQRSD